MDVDADVSEEREKDYIHVYIYDPATTNPDKQRMNFTFSLGPKITDTQPSTPLFTKRNLAFFADISITHIDHHFSTCQAGHVNDFRDFDTAQAFLHHHFVASAFQK